MCLPIRCNERSISEIFPAFSIFLEKAFGILISDNSTVECFKQKDSFFNNLGVPQVHFLNSLKKFFYKVRINGL